MLRLGMRAPNENGPSSRNPDQRAHRGVHSARARKLCCLSIALLWGFSVNATGRENAEAPSELAPNPELVAKAETLAVAIVSLRALDNQRGLANHESPLYALIDGNSQSGGAHLCAVERPSPPDQCVSPGPRPAVPVNPQLPCAWCDETPKDRAWQSYMRRHLGVNMLRALMELDRALGNFGQYARLGAVLSDTLTVLAKRNARGAALMSELKPLLTANSGATQEQVMVALLDDLIAAMDLSLDADDLSTEGGLEAAIKLSRSKLRMARVRWQTEFGIWAKCLNDARAAGKFARAEESAVQACNQSATRAQPPTSGELKAYMQWQKRKDAYRVCLQSNPAQGLAVARRQKVPCAPGASL